MAIIAPQTAPNFATGDYHRILKVELLCSPDDPVPRYHVLIGFYANEYARSVNSSPMYVRSVFIPFNELEEDPRVGIYKLLMERDPFVNTNAAPDVVVPDESDTSGESQEEA